MSAAYLADMARLIFEEHLKDLTILYYEVWRLKDMTTVLTKWIQFHIHYKTACLSLLDEDLTTARATVRKLMSELFRTKEGKIQLSGLGACRGVLCYCDRCLGTPIAELLNCCSVHKAAR
jgi:hypothetical protein